MHDTIASSDLMASKEIRFMKRCNASRVKCQHHGRDRPDRDERQQRHIATAHGQIWIGRVDRWCGAVPLFPRIESFSMLLP